MHLRNLFVILSLYVLMPMHSYCALWRRVVEIPQVNVASLHIAGNTLYAGADTTVYVSPDGGTTWNPATPIPANGAFIDAIISFDGKIFAGTGGSGIFMSSNGGTSWQGLNQGLSGMGSDYVNSFAVRGGALYAGTGGSGVFVLQGSTWSAFGQLTSHLAGTVNTLCAFGETLVAGAGGNGYAWFSGPGTSTFDGVPVGPFPGDIFLVTSFLQHGGFLFAGSNYGVYRSGNSGTTWTYVGTGIPNGRPVTLSVHGQALYAAASGAGTRVLRSTNLGADWETIDNIHFAYTTQVFGDRLYAARIDGLWYMNLLPTPVNEEPLPLDATLEQNHPNPFNPRTVIHFQHARQMVNHGGQATSNWITLRIFDVLGREVTTLVNEVRAPGEHTVEWNAEGFSSGVYLYRLTTGSQTITKRMLLLK